MEAQRGLRRFALTKNRALQAEPGSITGFQQIRNHLPPGNVTTPVIHRRLTVAGLALLAVAPAVAQTPPTERPKYFALYPPPPFGTYTPGHPPVSTATRRPDLFAPLPVYPNGRTFLVEGMLDLRSRPMGRAGRGLFAPAARLTSELIYADPSSGSEQGGFRVQFLAEPRSSMSDTPDTARLSEAYAFYKLLFPGALATVRAGQFVLPFGLAAVYGTSLQPFNVLAEKSVGLRVDNGVMVEGDYGPFHYAGSLTTGGGPNHIGRGGILAARLERHFLTQSGRIQIGGSMLTGRLPDTTPASLLPPSGTTSIGISTVRKTRFSADVQYGVANVTARGELVFGADDHQPVFGYFGDGRLAFSPTAQAVVVVKRWDYAERPESTHVAGFGVDLAVGRGLVVRTLIERETNNGPAGGSRLIDRRLTVQTQVRF